MKNVASVAVTWPNTAKAYSASMKRRMCASADSGQSSEPSVVMSMAVHHNAVPKLSKPGLCGSSRSKKYMPAAPAMNTTQMQI